MLGISRQLAVSALIDIGVHYVLRKVPSVSGFVLALVPIESVVFIGSFLVQVFLYPKYFSPYRKLPAPKNPHWLGGNYRDYVNKKYDQALDMERDYPGRDFVRFHGPMGMDVLIALSVEAHIQILQTNVYKFRKPDSVSRGFKQIIGNGLFFAEGNEHRVQRRLLTPAFTQSHVRTLVPVFMEKIKMLDDVIDNLTAAGPAVIQQRAVLSRLTLDAIGEATFGVNLHALDDEYNPLVEAYTRLATPLDDPLSFYLNSFIPGWSHIPTKSNKRMAGAKQIFRESCTKVLAERIDDVYKRKVEGKDRDMLSILLHDNDHQWTVDEVENQMMTLLLAGHETTAGAVAWALYRMAKNPEIQDRLRDEILEAFPNGADDIKDADAIESLKYLNNVVRECLRVSPPVPLTVRQASEDVVIGDTLILKDTNIQISIEALNKSTAIWGPDALEFNPGRWDKGIPDVYGYSTFIQGARSCLGRKLAELEFKCILAGMLARYKFELTSPDHKPGIDFIITAQPDDGMPLLVSRL
ncbi:cytochrome P450 [Limtongia smithiae]|uniref:cytochrome P450 n=1 Tax=Limtongia smithiae TaxID=1125753 RepID=UPI0034CDB291